MPYYGIELGLREDTDMTISYEGLLSVEEYLTVEEASPERHEYVAGRLFLMSGVTIAHSRLVRNLSRSLDDKVTGQGCDLFTSAVNVQVKALNCMYYPDLIVTCEPLQNTDRIVASPRLLIEVLSPSTKNIDLREKRLAYRTLPSLIEYVIVHQDKVLVEIDRRASADWDMLTFKAGDTVSFTSLSSDAFEIPIEKIYFGLNL
jgi:Uma2 family endonuclease